MATATTFVQDTSMNLHRRCTFICFSAAVVGLTVAAIMAPYPKNLAPVVLLSIAALAAVALGTKAKTEIPIKDTRQMDQVLLGIDSAAPSTEVNAPRTDEFVINPEGQRLHLRSLWPEVPAKGFVLSLHGYGAHGNRPTHAYLARQFNAAGLGYITVDFHGHGYSEGERGLVRGPANLLEDALSALVALFSSELAPSNGSHRIRRNVSKGTQFFVMGHSMGGGTALLVSNVLSNADAAPLKGRVYEQHREVFVQTIMPSFRGALLVCPVIDMGVSPLLRAAFVTPLSWAFPRSMMPLWLFDENSSNHLIWSSAAYRSFIRADGWPANPTGLSYGGNIRFQTLASILALSDAVMATLAQASFPFIILHDSAGDIVVPVAGTHKLMAIAPSRNKRFVDMPEGLHDIIANKAIDVGSEFLSWLAAAQDQSSWQAKGNATLTAEGSRMSRAAIAE